MVVNKRAIHHLLVVLRGVKLWQLVVVLLFMAFASAYLLRQNNLGMIERRNLVKMADEQNGDTQKALIELQKYVNGHMNTSLGDNGIYLQKSYERAYDKAIQDAATSTNNDNIVYRTADKECQATFNKTASWLAYVQCVAEKVGANNPAPDPLAAIKPPSADLYRYNFISPAWSPDLAGFAILFTSLLLVIVLGRFILMWVLYLLLRRHHQ